MTTTGTGDNSTNTNPDFEAIKARAQRLESELVNLQKEHERYARFGKPEDLQGKLEDYTLTKSQLDEIKTKNAGADPEKIKQLIAEKEQEIRRTVQSELEGFKSNLSKKEQELKELKLVDKTFSYAAGKITQGSDTYIKDIIRKHGDVDENGQIYFKDESGQKLYKKDKPSELLDAQGFIDTVLEKNPFFSLASIKGGDATGRGESSSTSTSGVTAAKFMKMTPEERKRIPVQDRVKLWDEAKKQGLS